MKSLVVACVMVLFSVSLACAEWNVDFRNTYAADGIDKAVENALKDGKKPDLIVEVAVEIEGLNPQNLIRALYCAGATGQDIRAAAEKYNIPFPIVTAGYKKSIDECGDRVADSQAYTPVDSGPNFTRPVVGRSGTSVSPFQFVRL